MKKTKFFKSLLLGSAILGYNIPIFYNSTIEEGKLMQSNYYGDNKNNIPEGYIYEASISYNNETKTINYKKPEPPINYNSKTIKDENGWATFDNNFLNFFINNSLAKLMAEYCEVDIYSNVSIEDFQKIHDKIFLQSNSYQLDLSHFYENDKYGYETIRAICNPRFAWVMKPDSKLDYNKFSLNLSYNNLIEIPDFSQMVDFDKETGTYNDTPLFKSGILNKGVWKVLNLENNKLMYIPYYTLPHLFPRVVLGSENSGIKLDFNLMPYIYHDSRIPSTDIDSYNVLPGRLINNSSINYTILYNGDISIITTVLEDLFKIGIYQKDGFNATGLSIHNYLVKLMEDQVITRNIYDYLPGDIYPKYQFLYTRVTPFNTKEDIDKFFSKPENEIFKYINYYIGQNWLVSQSTIYNSIFKFFQKIADSNQWWWFVSDTYEVPVQIYPNDPYGEINVRYIPPASKTEYFEDDIINEKNIQNGNLNNIANDIINAFSFNHGSNIVSIKGFKKSNILAIIYSCTILFLAIVLITSIFFIHKIKRNK